MSKRLRGGKLDVDSLDEFSDKYESACEQHPESQKTNLEEYMEFEGFRCPCGHRKIRFTRRNVQLRSADEGGADYFVCGKCKVESHKNL